MIRAALPPFIQSGAQHSVITGVDPVERMKAIRRSRSEKSYTPGDGSGLPAPQPMIAWSCGRDCPASSVRARATASVVPLSALNWVWVKPQPSSGSSRAGPVGPPEPDLPSDGPPVEPLMARTSASTAATRPSSAAGAHT